MAKIYYAVIALTQNETPEVIQEIKNKNMNQIADWLNNNKNKLYAQDRDGWKPFMDKSIRELLETETQSFESATSQIDELDDSASNITLLLDTHIELYIIDVFALFKPKFINLATKLDFHLAQRGKCCLVMPYGLSEGIIQLQKPLVTAYSNLWRSVYKEYKKGSLHRIVMMPDELSNFLEYLLVLSKEDRPSLSAAQQLTKMFEEFIETKLPRV